MSVDCMDCISLVPLGTTEMFERAVETKPWGNRELLVHSLMLCPQMIHIRINTKLLEVNLKVLTLSLHSWSFVKEVVVKLSSVQ